MSYLDLKFFLNPSLYGYYGTFLMGEGDAKIDDWVGTSITVSLGTNCRVDGIERPDNGWWGEALLGVNIGSKLYLLDRTKAIRDTLILAKQYAEEALQWLVDEGHLASIESVDAVDIGGNQIQIVIKYRSVDGEINRHLHVFSLSEGA